MSEQNPGDAEAARVAITDTLCDDHDIEWAAADALVFLARHFGEVSVRRDGRECAVGHADGGYTLRVGPV